MDQPIFLSQETRRPLEWNAEAGVYVRPQFSGHWFVQAQVPPNRVLAIHYENKLIALVRDDALGGYRLKTNSNKTKEIANKVNYADSRSFRRIFYKHTALSPKSYRMKYGPPDAYKSALQRSYSPAL